VELSSVWVKIAGGKKLTPQELDFLKRTGDETQLRNSFVAGNKKADGTLDIQFPFVSVFSEILEVSTSEVTVQIPGNLNHLFVFSSGRTDAAAVSSVLRCRINGDSATNYKQQNMLAVNTTVTGSYDYTADHGVIGGLAGTSASAGKSESSVAFLSNIQSPFHKTISTLFSGLDTDSTYTVGLKTSYWAVVDKIKSLTFSSSSGNILAGSIISIYGVI